MLYLQNFIYIIKKKAQIVFFQIDNIPHLACVKDVIPPPPSQLKQKQIFFLTVAHSRVIETRMFFPPKGQWGILVPTSFETTYTHTHTHVHTYTLRTMLTDIRTNIQCMHQSELCLLDLFKTDVFRCQQGVCMYACTYLCMYVCMRVLCVCVCACVWSSNPSIACDMFWLLVLLK